MTRRFAALAVTCAVALGVAPIGAQITAEDAIYFIITDRFRDGDAANNFSVRPTDARGYHGGDFAGIIASLDYIADLGFTAIWISPVVDNAGGAYHGYWAVDFYGVEAHFGTMESLRDMVAAAHARDMAVIVDLVVNHTGNRHPWLSDPAYADWFNERIDLRNATTQAEVERYWLSGLPDMNFDNPEVRDYFIEMALWWIDQTGIDGYRLDTVKHVPQSFWRDFATAIHDRYPDFYLVGEVFDGNHGYVGAYQNTGMDGLLDFPLYFPVREFINNDGPGTEVARAMRAAASYPDRMAMGTFIDNHDVARFIHQERRDRDAKVRLGLLYLFTYTGIPVMYYGTEIPLDGGSDHGNRADMVWDRTGDYVADVRRLTTLRRERPALATGEFALLGAAADWVAYARSGDGEAYVVILNNATAATEVTVAIGDLGRNARSARDLLGEAHVPVRRGEVTVALPAMTGALLELSPERIGLFKRLFGRR